jgi:hypothetical protein
MGDVADLFGWDPDAVSALAHRARRQPRPRFNDITIAEPIRMFDQRHRRLTATPSDATRITRSPAMIKHHYGPTATDDPLPRRDPGVELSRQWPTPEDLDVAERQARFQVARPSTPLMQGVLDGLAALPPRSSPP